MIDEHADPKIRVSAAAALAVAGAMAGEQLVARDAIGFCSVAVDVGSVELRAVIRHRLAYAHLCLGEAAIAEGYATECVQIAHSVGLDSIAARGYSVLQAVANAIYPDTILARKYAESCARHAALAGDRSMQIFGLQAQLMVASYQGDDDLYDETERQLIDLGAERSSRVVMWMRFVKVVRETGRDNVALAISTLRSVENEKLSAPERAFGEALLALLLVSRNREEAARLLSRPILLEAERDVESRSLLAHAQIFHALGQWLLGRGKAARRAPRLDFSSVTPRDAALLTVISTICSTSRQTTTSRQLAQLTEPLLALCN